MLKNVQLVHDAISTKTGAAAGDHIDRLFKAYAGDTWGDHHGPEEETEEEREDSGSECTGCSTRSTWDEE